MRPRRHHAEHHRNDRIGWLRAAVLGANDGIVSTASLVLGVAAAGADHRTLFMTSVAGLIAGAMSMAAGEFVSVHSQADTETADLERERGELVQNPRGEHRELAAIYVGRGLDQTLADEVARQLMARDALGAVSARNGGAPVWAGTWRVTLWGALAMGVTAGAGMLFGAVG